MENNFQLPETYRLRVDVWLDLGTYTSWTHVFSGIDNFYLRFSPIHHDWQDLKVKMIKNKVSDGEPYNYSNKKGRQPVGMWVKPMEEQTDESVVFAKAQSLTDELRTEIEFAVPRRKWSSLKI